MTRLVIYTVLVGNKEPLGNPIIDLIDTQQSDLEIDFVCFTDNRELRSDVWSFRLLSTEHLPPEKLSRRPKALPHEYLQNWDVSLYIDNIVRFKRLPRIADLESDRPYLFRTYRHVYREHLIQEADVIAVTGYDDVDMICHQLDFYSQFGPTDAIRPISTCTVILRTHHHPALKRFGTVWWEQILNFSKRDQMSFDFSLRNSGARVEYFPGTKDDNDLIHNPVNTLKGRVKANFDPQRYAWRHRHDPEAMNNPRGHYLAHQDDVSSADSDYMCRTEVFRYICHKTCSSLGAFHSPRRRIDGVLQAELMPYKNLAGRLLLVSVMDDEELSFSAEESRAAALAISSYMGGFKGSVVEVNARDLSGQALQVGHGDEEFDVIVVLGVMAQKIPHLFSILIPICKRGHAGIIAIASEEVALDMVAEIAMKMTAKLNARVATSLNASWHDSVDTHIPNSVVSFHVRAEVQR